MVNETHTQAPETQDEETKLPEPAELEGPLLEKPRIGDSEKGEDYGQLIASIEADLRISPEQRKVHGTGLMTDLFTYSQLKHSPVPGRVANS